MANYTENGIIPDVALGMYRPEVFALGQLREEGPAAVSRRRRDDSGYALGLAQQGGFPPTSKPCKGEGPGVFELVEDFRGDAYRVACMVRFEKAIYVLHCYQKKSPSGIRTARTDARLIRERLRVAPAGYEVRHGQKT